jgi:hypothetical protein
MNKLFNVNDYSLKGLGVIRNERKIRIAARPQSQTTRVSPMESMRLFIQVFFAFGWTLQISENFPKLQYPILIPRTREKPLKR